MTDRHFEQPLKRNLMKFFSLGDLTTASPWIYDCSQRLISFNYALIKDHLKRWSGLHAGNSCLDVACGVGALKPFLESQQLRYHGMDINQQYLDYARRRHGPVFELLDARNLSQLQQEFDVLLSVGLFHHLANEDCQRVLREARSVLKEDGQYFVLDAIPAKPGNPVGAFLRKQDAGSYVRNLDEWRDLFGEFFTIDKALQCARWPYDYGVFHLRKRAK